MRKRSELTGIRFGRLMVEKFAETKNKHSHWVCRCDCGAIKTVSADKLKSGDTKSCGCLSREIIKATHANKTTHGYSGSYLYDAWADILKRCNNPSNKSYKNYGGRGIKVHPDFEKFENFLGYIIENLGPRGPGQSLDRIDNDLGYEPGNLRWASRRKQGRNKRNNAKVTVFGEILTLIDAVEAYGMASYSTVRGRIGCGWPIEKALTTPSRKVKK